MKISGNGLETAPVAKTRDVTSSGTTAAPAKKAGKDDVALSSDASGLSNVSLGTAPRGASASLMKQLSDAISGGTYNVDREKLASKIIDGEASS